MRKNKIIATIAGAVMLAFCAETSANGVAADTETSHKNTFGTEKSSCIESETRDNEENSNSGESDPRAEKRVREVIAHMKKTCYEGSFSMTYTSGSTGSSNRERGTLTVDGLRYKLVLGENFTMYDGTTHWAYSKDMNEVTVMEPLEEELETINPIVMIESYLNNYRVCFGDGKGIFEFYPKDAKSDPLTKVTLMLDEEGLPFQVVANSRNGDRTTFIWEGVLKTEATENMFTFSETDYPGVEINDLR